MISWFPMTSFPVPKGQAEPTWSIRHPLWLYWAKSWPESPCKESYSAFFVSTYFSNAAIYAYFLCFHGVPMTSIPNNTGQDEHTWSIWHPLWLY